MQTSFDRLRTTPARRQLDRWAVIQGFANFDVYLQAGGSFLGAAAEMRREQQQIDMMLAYIGNFSRQPLQPRDGASQPVATNGDTSVVGPEALARAEAEQYGEPVEPDNAQIQGCDEHA